ncbi:ABC transporter ATP-binding protein [Brachybacterium hainanense]|uniref:ATP-binding cassette domain-containing protein n=1 Tax=Brachybacterium hainanense TaxID=1541174 RepID=A0ABV6RG97_9MICO
MPLLPARPSRPGLRTTEPGDPGPIPAVSFHDVAVLREDVLMLDGASGRVQSGQILALTGRNGSGKTTLLRVLAGLLAPTAGQVAVLGRVPDERDRRFRRSLAALIGPPMSARDLTVEENLRFIAATWGARADPAQEHAAHLLESLSIGALAGRYPHELSSGQSQLVAIAMTLSRPFDVLLLDEPEQRLDAERLDLVIGLLAQQAEQGAAIVLASHSPRLVEALADVAVHLEAEA